MAIQSLSEISVVLADILMKVDRMLDMTPNHQGLQAAKKNMSAVEKCIRSGKEPTLLMLHALNGSADTVRTEAKDEGIADKLYDIQDYFAANAK